MNPFDIPKKFTQLQIELVASMMEEEGHYQKEQQQQAEYKSQMAQNKNRMK